jgi:hypothetical protein
MPTSTSPGPPATPLSTTILAALRHNAKDGAVGLTPASTEAPLAHRVDPVAELLRDPLDRALSGAELLFGFQAQKLHLGKLPSYAAAPRSPGVPHGAGQVQTVPTVVEALQARLLGGADDRPVARGPLTAVVQDR